MISRSQMKGVIVGFHEKYNGNWENVYNAIKNKEDISPIELENAIKMVEKKDPVVIMDADYPNNFKAIYMPPLTLFTTGDRNMILPEAEEKTCSVFGELSVDKLESVNFDKENILAVNYNKEDMKNYADLLENGYKLKIIGEYINKQDFETLSQFKQNCLVMSEVDPELTKPDIDTEQTQARLVLGAGSATQKTYFLGESGSQAQTELQPLLDFEKRTNVEVDYKQTENQTQTQNQKLN